MIDESNLEFIPSAKFMRKCPILFISDCPLQNEVDKSIGFSSQSAKREFESLQNVGIQRGHIHATYCFNFRPENGELSAIFWRKGLPVEGYASWGSEKNIFILDYAYNELKRLREEIKQSEPSLIICSGKWSLYFLTQLTNQKDTAKSSYGTLMKWRASSLKLSEWWEYSKDCLLIPILPINSKWQLPGLQYLVQWDLERLRKFAKAAIAGTIADYMNRLENFIVPSSEAETINYFIQVRETLLMLLEKAEQGTLFLACDVETASYAYIDCLGIAWSNSEAICIPFATKANSSFWNEQDEVEIYSLLQPLLLHKNVKHIGQNYAYDMQYFWRNMLLRIAPEQDTMIMNHVMFSTIDKNLGFLSSLYCKIHRWWKDEGKTNKGATDIERWIYNCRDCCTTFEIAGQLKSLFEQSSSELQQALEFQTKGVLPAITAVMEQGIKLNSRLRDTQISELLTRAHLLELQFKNAIGEDINLNSSQQMKELFYDLFQCKKVWKKVTDDNGITKNVLSLDEDTLKGLWETELLIRPFIDILLDYKRLTKTASGLKALTLDTDGRLRCSYNICGTDTYRFSSNANAFGTGTNLQVISKGKKLRNGEYLPNSKQLFIPDTGYKFFDIDLSAADARIVAWESDSKELKEIMLSGQDLYTIIAREYYRDQTIQKDDARRQTFKMLCHGSNYLGSAAGLAARAGLLVVDVERVQRYYFGRFPEVTAWHNKLRMQVRNKKRITNVFGFQRWFFDQSMPTLMQVAAAWAPQSTVAILINHGMINIKNNLPQVKVLLQTHDSLAGIFPETFLEAEEAIKRECSIALPYNDPLIIPVDIRSSLENWGKC